MDMQTFFSEITALCRDEQFLHSVMKKYHYDPEEYPNLKRMAGEMIPCLETEAGWQDREIQETFPGRDQSFLAVGITLGKGIDELQEKYLQNGFLTESYMIEVLSSELLLESYRAYTEWVVVHRNLHVARLHFLGGEISETSEQKISSLLRLANLPMLLQELALPVTCNAAYKRQVLYDPEKKCGILCGTDKGSFYQMCRNLSGVRQERLPEPHGGKGEFPSAVCGHDGPSAVLWVCQNFFQSGCKIGL